MLDLPPAVPPQYEPVVIAQSSQAQKAGSKGERTIGVCHLIQNPPIPPGTAVNVISPLRAAKHYMNTFENQYPQLKGTVSIMLGPEHGELKVTPSGNYRYYPIPDYQGSDRATLLVHIGDFKVKAMYYFKIGPGAPGGTEGYDPYEDKENCPKGHYWKISHNTK